MIAELRTKEGTTKTIRIGKYFPTLRIIFESSYCYLNPVTERISLQVHEGSSYKKFISTGESFSPLNVHFYQEVIYDEIKV